jgi:serine/threonine protein kinase
MVRLINQGSIAKVYEVVKRDSGRTFAIKVLPKHRLVSESLVGTVFHERNVLVQSLASCPFIADLKYSFQTTRHLFLVTDYFAGGELFDFFEHERCLNETWCQFIAAEIVCALDHIHSRNMVYCNLKLENILLDAHGHLALTHFGLCQQLETDQDDAIYGVSNNVTQEYMAPEMVLQRPYGKLVDWWSLGILMFELLTGSPPFHSVNEVELIRQIMYGPIKFPAGGCISKEAKDFVYQLLHRHPAKRLGYRSGASQVKAHPFFDTVNWDMVYKKQMQCPFRLEIQNQLQEKAADSIRIIPATTNTATAMKTKTIKPQVIPALDQTIFNGFSFAGEDGSIKKGLHILGVDPDDEDPEVDVWFRK